MNWYQFNIKEIMQKLGTSEEGLTDNEATERLKQYGPNKLIEEEKISKLKILFHQFKSPLIYILLVAAVVTAFLKEYTDTSVFFEKGCYDCGYEKYVNERTFELMKENF